MVKRPCKARPCPGISTEPHGYCNAHLHLVKARPDLRPPAKDRGYNYRWSKFSREFLGRHPACRECAKKGITTKATLTDHLVPKWLQIDLGVPESYRDEDYQPLCVSCNTKKGKEQRRKG